MNSESDTVVSLPAVGDLTYREIHAVLDGLYCGTVGRREHEYWQEKHYWRVGYLVGAIVLDPLVG